MQLDRIKRFIKTKEKKDERAKSYEKARQKLQQKKDLMSGAGLGSIGSLISFDSFAMPQIDLEQDIEDEIQKEEDELLIKAIKKQNRKTCFCFK